MSDHHPETGIRLDKWLWSARFYKTRALAREMVDGGKVQYNGQRTKPGKIVEIGAMLKIRQGYTDKEIRVLGLSIQRQSAVQAQSLYEETQDSMIRREKLMEAHKLNALYAPHPDSKPDKKQRRDLMRWKQGEH